MYTAMSTLIHSLSMTNISVAEYCISASPLGKTTLSHCFNTQVNIKSVCVNN